MTIELKKIDEDGIKIEGPVLAMAAKALNTITMDACVKIDDDGNLQVNAVDASHVAGMRVEYGKVSDSCSEFVMDLKNTSTLLSKSKWDKLEGRGENKKAKHVLTLKIEGNDYTIGCEGVSIKAKGLDPASYGSPNFPKIEHKVEVEVERETLLRDITMARSLVGDLITLHVVQGKFFVSCVGKQNEMSAVGNAVVLKGESDCVSQYSMSYLLPALKSMKSDTVVLKFANCYPLTVESELDLGYVSGRKLKTWFFLAPRVEKEY
jgi:hypothetical protein